VLRGKLAQQLKQGPVRVTRQIAMQSSLLDFEHRFALRSRALMLIKSYSGARFGQVRIDERSDRENGEAQWKHSNKLSRRFAGKHVLDAAISFLFQNSTREDSIRRSETNPPCYGD
jgi:hypothetical protein